MKWERVPSFSNIQSQAKKDSLQLHDPVVHDTHVFQWFRACRSPTYKWLHTKQSSSYKPLVPKSWNLYDLILSFLESGVTTRQGYVVLMASGLQEGPQKSAFVGQALFIDTEQRKFRSYSQLELERNDNWLVQAAYPLRTIILIGMNFGTLVTTKRVWSEKMHQKLNYLWHGRQLIYKVFKPWMRRAETSSPAQIIDTFKLHTTGPTNGDWNRNKLSIDASATWRLMRSKVLCVIITKMVAELKWI